MPTQALGDCYSTAYRAHPMLHQTAYHAYISGLLHIALHIKLACKAHVTSIKTLGKCPPPTPPTLVSWLVCWNGLFPSWVVSFSSPPKFINFILFIFQNFIWFSTWLLLGANLDHWKLTRTTRLKSPWLPLEGNQDYQINHDYQWKVTRTTRLK